MVYLEDLLNARDFRQAVYEIAKDFRAAHNFPDIHQLGIVVPDVEEAAAKLEARGIGPFFIAASVLPFWSERGQLKPYRGKLGLACYQGFELELLEPGVGSSFYQSCVDPECRMVVQHLGFRVHDVDAQAAKLEASGSATWVRGKVQNFPLQANFAYMDTVVQAGIILEFIEMRLFGLPLSIPGGVYHALGRVEKALGIRSLSL